MKKIICTLAAAYCGYFGFFPFAYRIFRAGSLILLAFCAGFLLLGYWKKPKEKGRSFTAYRLFIGTFSFALAVAGILSASMLYAGWFRPPASDQPATVVILGCQAGGGKPSLMLLLRIVRATAYLKAHPETPVVATGGYDAPGEPMTEAQVIEAELIARKIAPTRIYREDRSESTRENLLYAAEVIEENNLPDRVIIVTDGFHQLRGQLYARRAGLKEPTGIPARTPWGLAPSYWTREWGGLLVMLFGW